MRLNHKHEFMIIDFIEEIKQKIEMLLVSIKLLVNRFLNIIFSTLDDENFLKKLTNPLLLSNAFYLILKFAQDKDVFDKLLKKHDDETTKGWAKAVANV